MTHEDDISTLLNAQTPQEIRQVLTCESLWEVALERALVSVWGLSLVGTVGIGLDTPHNS